MFVISVFIAMNLVQSFFGKVAKTVNGETTPSTSLYQPPYISEKDCRGCENPCPDQDHAHYPSYLAIDNMLPLLNSMKPYTRHVLISTGIDNWKDSHIEEDRDGLAFYLEKAIEEGQRLQKKSSPSSGVTRIVLTNSSRFGPMDDHHLHDDSQGSNHGPLQKGFQVVILPDQIVVNNVTPQQCPDFFEAFLKDPVGYVAPSSSSLSVPSSPLLSGESKSSSSTTTTQQNGTHEVEKDNGKSITTSTTTTTVKTLSSSQSSTSNKKVEIQDENTKIVTVGSSRFISHKLVSRAAIMICSHRKRDKRCGVTAPILKKEFEKLLRQKDILGDGPGDVEIWMVSHIGGHKFAGNVIVHREEGMAVWYGRVDPCHTEAIVEETVLKGNVIQEIYRGSMDKSFEPVKKIAW